MTRLLVLAVVACGADTGDVQSNLDPNVRLHDLSGTQIGDLCNYDIAVEGNRTVDCGNGTMVTLPQGADECASEIDKASVSCPATVGDNEACIHALVADPCGFLMMRPPACAPLVACGLFP